MTHIPGLQQLLRFVARTSLRYPLWTCLLWLAAGVVALITTAAYLKVDANEDNLISEKLPYNKAYRDFLRTFGDLEFVYAVIEVPAAPDSTDWSYCRRAAEAADDLAERLAELKQEGLLREVVAEVPLPQLEKRFFLYEEPERLERDLGEFTAARPLLKLFLENGDLLSVLQGVRVFFAPERFTHGKDDQAVSEGELARGARLLKDLFAGIRQAASPGPLPEAPQLLPPPPYDLLRLRSHLFTQKGSPPDPYDPSRPGLVLVQILPQKDFTSLLVIDEPLRRMREALLQTKRKYPDLAMGLTGRPVIHADEMATTNRDVATATYIAFPLVTVLFFLLFRSVRRPAFSLVSLGIGIACTYGFVTVVLGRVNLLSVVFILILIGLGVDYGIHILARYLEELQKGSSPEQAALRSVLRAGRGCVAAALTSAVAFFSALWTDFTGLGELGLASGAGVLFCLATAVSFLPAALCLLDRRRARGKHVRPVVALPFLEVIPRVYRPLLAGACCLAVLIVPFVLAVRFNRNLLELQAKGLQSVTYERLLIRQSAVSTWEGVCIVGSAEEARALAKRLASLPEVRQAETIDSLLVAPEREKHLRQVLLPVYDALKTIRVAPVSPEVKLKELRQLLGKFVALTKLVPSGVVPKEWHSVIENVQGAWEALKAPQVSTEQLRRRLETYQRALLEPPRGYFRTYLAALNPPRVSVEDLDPVLRRRFVAGQTGQHLVRVYPAGDAWEYPVLEKFVQAVREVFPPVTGVAVNFYESVKVMERAFAVALAIAFSCVTVLVFIDMQSLRYGLLSLGTLLAGVLYTLGAMGVFGLEINLANFFAFPVMLGIGIDSAFHLIHRFRENGTSAPCLSPITAMAVVLSSLTSLIGLGSLMTASHRGVASLGKLLALGTGICLLASLVFLPAFLCAFGDRIPPPWIQDDEKELSKKY